MVHRGGCRTRPSSLSYVEIVKKYPLLPADEGCGLETFVSGWIHHDDGLQKPRARLKAVISYCDRRSVSYMLPFGQLRLAGRTHWVVQMSGRDHEWYARDRGPRRRGEVRRRVSGRAAAAGVSHRIAVRAQSQPSRPR